MHLMFDLDGTLTDSRMGVIRCIQHALAEAGVVVPSAEELTRYVGPPLPGAFATLLGPADTHKIEGAIAAYRRRFEQVGIFENVLYPGIAEMLTELATVGYSMCVVTAKPRIYARQILEHFGIARLFHDVYGPELGERNYTKESLIREACVMASPPIDRGMMVGDRAEDVRGAKSNGLGAVAVAWGYGNRDELDAAHPDRIVASTGELLEYIAQAGQLPDGAVAHDGNQHVVAVHDSTRRR
jgi:phosphoglycolate phosphatase